MRIHSLSVREIAERSWHLSAQVEEHRIWFEISGLQTEPPFSYDPFVLAAFLKAMDQGEDITVHGDGPVSAPLLRNLEKIAVLATGWWPYLSGGRVQAENVEAVPDAGSDQVGSFFSGGADSLFTFSRNSDEISHLILCWGLDIADHEEERWHRTKSHVAAFADHHGRSLVTIQTNIKKPLRAPGKADNHGALLASTGLTLGFGKLLIPATNPLHRLEPHGSHPFLDPLFSNGSSEVVHDSPIRRSDKMEAIAQNGGGLEFLRVCNRASDYNCGSCEKCLRTRAALSMLGAESEALEPMKAASELRGLKLQKPIEYDYWTDNLELAKRLGRADMVSEIGRLLRSWRTREALRQLDSDWFGGAGIRLKRRLKPGR